MKDWIIFIGIFLLTIVLVKGLFKTKGKKKNEIPPDGSDGHW
jgi:hypothetical protein